MSIAPLKIEDLRELIKNGEAKDPLVFLEAIMNGLDPRKFSGIYELIMEVDSFSNGEVDQSDWQEIIDYTINHAKYKEVSLSESHSAAKTIAEYLHAKRKNIDINGGGMGEGSIHNDPLTEEEIELFKERFNDDF